MRMSSLCARKVRKERKKKKKNRWLQTIQESKGENKEMCFQFITKSGELRMQEESSELRNNEVDRWMIDR